MRNRLLTLLVTIVLLPAGGCSGPTEDPVRVGLLVWPPYELAYLARERDYFDSGRVELVTFHTPAEMVRSYRFGIIDAMYVTSQFVLTNTGGMGDSRIVHVIDFSAGGDALLSQPDIVEPAQLKGKRVGMEAGPLGAYTLTRALDRTELDRSDVEIVFIDTPDQLPAFEAGELDAIATYEPTRSVLLKKGANELFNSIAIPLEIIDVLIARDWLIESDHDKLAELLRGVDRALSDFRREPEATAAIMAERQGLTVDEFLQAMRGVRLLNLQENLALFRGTDDRLYRGLQRQAEVMEEAEMLARRPDIPTLVDDRILEEALAR